MTRRSLGGLAACAAASAIAVYALQGAQAATGPSTIRITDVQQRFTRVDQGRTGRGVGDVEIVRLVLYNTRITRKPIGHGDLVCTILPGAARSCTATYTLPKGKLVVGGVIGSRLLYESPVLGGTGLYDNARGYVVVTASSVTPRREILVFRLTG